MAWATLSQFNSFAEALSNAWRIIKLQAKMKLGSVSFTFKKIDGSLRKAVGSLKDTPATVGSDKAKNYGVMTYFDVESNGWRSFKVENLVG